METSDISNWQAVHTQTDSALRAEERRLEAVNRELNAEQAKYQRVKESFQKTKERLLDQRKVADSPAAALRDVEAMTKRLNQEKKGLEDASSRVTHATDKVKEQSILVMQNKKKLEVIEEKIMQLMQRRNSKILLREELEILDSKILQLISQKVQLKKESALELTTKEEIKEATESDLEKTEKVEKEDTVYSQISLEAPSISGFSQDSASSQQGGQEQYRQSQQSNDSSNQQQQQQAQYIATPTDNVTPRVQAREYYEKMQAIQYLSEDGKDSLSLKYVNAHGHAFEVEVRKEGGKGLVIDIRPHSKVDSNLLMASRREIIASLKEQGLSLDKVVIRGAGSNV